MIRHKIVLTVFILIMSTYTSMANYVDKECKSITACAASWEDNEETGCCYEINNEIPNETDVEEYVFPATPSEI